MTKDKNGFVCFLEKRFAIAQVAAFIGRKPFCSGVIIWTKDITLHTRRAERVWHVPKKKMFKK